MPLLKYADLVHVWCDGDNILLDALAKKIIPMLKRLASPCDSMPFCRLHSEKLVLLLGKEVQFQDETMSGVGRLARACPCSHEKGDFLVLKIKGNRPREFTVQLNALLKGTFEIKEHLETERDGSIELAEEEFEIVSSP